MVLNGTFRERTSTPCFVVLNLNLRRSGVVGPSVTVIRDSAARVRADTALPILGATLT